MSLSVCRRYAGDRMEADDFNQLGWMRAFDRIGQYGAEGSLEGWLRQVFVHVCLNEVASRKRRLSWLLPLPTEGEAADWPALTPAAADFLAQERLIEAIASLPEGARLIFNLHAVEGYGHAEIAQALRISEGNSRSQLLRARQLLAQRLTPAALADNPKSANHAKKTT